MASNRPFCHIIRVFDESVDNTLGDEHNTLSQFHSGKSLPYKGRISREGD